MLVDAERNTAEVNTQPAKSIERYPITQAVEREITVAKAIHREASVAAKAIFTQMLQSGRLDVHLARDDRETPWWTA